MSCSICKDGYNNDSVYVCDDCDERFKEALNSICSKCDPCTPMSELIDNAIYLALVRYSVARYNVNVNKK